MGRTRVTSRHSKEYIKAKNDCVTAHRIPTPPEEVERLDAIAEKLGYNWYEDPSEHPELQRKIEKDQQTLSQLRQAINKKQPLLFESDDEDTEQGMIPQHSSILINQI
jgi:hypothetical protein